MAKRKLTPEEVTPRVQEGCARLVSARFGMAVDIMASGTASMKLDSSSWHKEQLTKLAQDMTPEERSTMMYLLEDHIQAVGGFTEGEVAWLRQTFS